MMIYAKVHSSYRESNFILSSQISTFCCNFLKRIVVPNSDTQFWGYPNFSKDMRTTLSITALHMYIHTIQFIRFSRCCLSLARRLSFAAKWKHVLNFNRYLVDLVSSVIILRVIGLLLITAVDDYGRYSLKNIFCQMNIGWIHIKII